MLQYWKQLTLRRKATVVLLGCAAVMWVWASKDPRGVSHGSWDIEPGTARQLGLTASKAVRMKVECVPTGGGAYAVRVVDAGSSEVLAEEEGSGPLTIHELSVTAGTYYVVVENSGPGRLSVTYRVYQLPR